MCGNYEPANVFGYIRSKRKQIIALLDLILSRRGDILLFLEDKKNKIYSYVKSG